MSYLTSTTYLDLQETDFNSDTLLWY